MQKLQLRCSEPISISSHTKHLFYQMEEIEIVKTQRGGFPEKKEKSRKKEKDQDEARVYFY